jgi:hypothetical protein
MHVLLSPPHVRFGVETVQNQKSPRDRSRCYAYRTLECCSQ